MQLLMQAQMQSQMPPLGVFSFAPLPAPVPEPEQPAVQETHVQQQPDQDLMWMMRLPIMELNPVNDQIYFIQQP
jgi:hypothetical protein